MFEALAGKLEGVFSRLRGRGKLTPENVRSIRPGHGLLPRELPRILGRHAARDLHRGEPLEWNMVASGSFFGDGRYTRGAPQGKFPLAISFTLADGNDIADDIPPQGSRGWLRGYLP